MLKARYLVALLVFAFVVGGCLGCDECADTNTCSWTNAIETESGLGAIARCRSIDGRLYVHHAAGLTSLDLPCLDWLYDSHLDTGYYSWYYDEEGYLAIINNAALTSIDMRSLTTVEGYLEISDNNALTSLSGFSSLASVGGDLRIQDNDALTGIDMRSLTTVEGWMDIRSNEGLISLAGLSSLTTVGGDLAIQDNDGLISLVGLSSLTAVDGFLGILDNDDLANLWGLSSLESLGGLVIEGNGCLTSLAGVTSLESVGGLSISNNATLASLNGLSGLATVGAGVYIFENDCLSQAEAEAFAVGLTEYGIIEVRDNGANYPCD